MSVWMSYIERFHADMCWWGGTNHQVGSSWKSFRTIRVIFSNAQLRDGLKEFYPMPPRGCREAVSAESDTVEGRLFLLGGVLVGFCYRRTPGWGELELCGIMRITTGNGVHCAVVMCGARLVSEAWTYLHKGSFSQSRGNPIARMSMLGYWLKSDLNFWEKSLWGFMAFNQ